VAAVPGDRLTHEHSPWSNPNPGGLPERRTRDIGCSPRHDHPPQMPKSEAVFPGRESIDTALGISVI